MPVIPPGDLVRLQTIVNMLWSEGKPGACMSHQRPGDADAAGLWTTLLSSEHLEERALDTCVLLVLRSLPHVYWGGGCQRRVRLGSSKV